MDEGLGHARNPLQHPRPPLEQDAHHGDSTITRLHGLGDARHFLDLLHGEGRVVDVAGLLGVRPLPDADADDDGGGRGELLGGGRLGPDDLGGWLTGWGWFIDRSADRSWGCGWMDG